MEQRCLVIAHRGASGLAPENTMASIDKALEIGVDMIEVDVRQSADHVIVLLHDRKINRTTNGTGYVQELSFESLQQFDAGSWFSPAFASQRIPALEMVLEKVKGRCGLLIEVKDGDRMYPDFVQRLVAIIQRHDAHSWCIVQSFNSAILRALHAKDEKIELNKLIVGKVPAIPLYYDSGFKYGRVYDNPMTRAVNPNKRYFSKRTARNIKRGNQKSYCWTVNDAATMKRLIALGVDGIITDYPNRLQAVLDELFPNPAYP